MSASEQDTGQQDTGQQDTGDQDGSRRPVASPPHALRLPFARALQHSSILLTYRPPPRRAPGDANPIPAAEPESGSKQPPPAQAQKADSGTADPKARATGSLLDTGLLVLGVVLVVCSRVTLTQTWAWSWHAGQGTTFTLSRMHGACTSAMGELAQGASGDVASHCLWVDTTWTAVVALGAAGCILAVLGAARMVRAVMKPV